MKKLITITLAATLSVGSVMSASAADFTDSAVVTQEETDSWSEEGETDLNSEMEAEETETEDPATEIEEDTEEPEILDEDFASEDAQAEIQEEDADETATELESGEISAEEEFTDSEESMDAVGASSGTCGDNVKWKINGTTLTLSGSGAMYNYWGSSSTPWSDQREYISRVVISDNITTIGDCAFYEFKNIRSITIGNKVTTIGERAFEDCYNLQSVRI